MCRPLCTGTLLPESLQQGSTAMTDQTSQSSLSGCPSVDRPTQLLSEQPSSRPHSAPAVLYDNTDLDFGSPPDSPVSLYSDEDTPIDPTRFEKTYAAFERSKAAYFSSKEKFMKDFEQSKDECVSQNLGTKSFSNCETDPATPTTADRFHMRKLALQTDRKAQCNKPAKVCKANARYIHAVQKQLAELKALQRALDLERQESRTEQNSDFEAHGLGDSLGTAVQEVADYARGACSLVKLAGRLAFCRNSTERRLLETAYHIHRNKMQHLVNVSASAMQVALASTWKGVVVEVVRLVAMYCPFACDSVVSLCTEIWEGLTSFCSGMRGGAQVPPPAQNLVAHARGSVSLDNPEASGFLGCSLALAFIGKAANLANEASRLTLLVGRHAKAILDSEKAWNSTTELFSKVTSWFKAALLFLLPENMISAEFLEYLRSNSINLSSFVRRVNEVANPEPRVRAAKLYDSKTAEELSDLNNIASSIQFAIVEKQVNPGSNVAHTVASAIKTLRDFTVYYYSSATCEYSRMTPFVVCFFGKPGVGKSLFLNDFAHAIVSKENGSTVDWKYDNLIISNSSASKYYDNYKGQEIEIQDDFGTARGAAALESEFVQQTCKVSSVPWFPPMAAVEEKGTPYRSRVILQTTNTPFPEVNEMYCVSALDRRRNLLVEVEVADPSLPIGDPNRCTYHLCRPEGSRSIDGQSYIREKSYLEKGLTFDQLIFRTVNDINSWVDKYNQIRQQPQRNIYSTMNVSDDITECEDKLRSFSLPPTARAYYRARLEVLAKNHHEAFVALERLSAHADDGLEDESSQHDWTPSFQPEKGAKKCGVSVPCTNYASSITTWKHAFAADPEVAAHMMRIMWNEPTKDRVVSTMDPDFSFRFSDCQQCDEAWLLRRRFSYASTDAKTCCCCFRYHCKCAVEVREGFLVCFSCTKVVAQEIAPQLGDDEVRCWHKFEQAEAYPVLERNHDGWWEFCSDCERREYTYEENVAAYTGCPDNWCTFSWSHRGWSSHVEYYEYTEWCDAIIPLSEESAQWFAYNDLLKDLPRKLTKRGRNPNKPGKAELDGIVQDLYRLYGYEAHANDEPADDLPEDAAAQMREQADTDFFHACFEDLKSFLTRPYASLTTTEKIIRVGLTVVSGLLVAVTMHRVIAFIGRPNGPFERFADRLYEMFDTSKSNGCQRTGCQNPADRRISMKFDVCAACDDELLRTCFELTGHANFYGEGELQSAFKRRRIYSPLEAKELSAEKPEIVGQKVTYEANGSEDPNSLSIKHALGRKNCVSLHMGAKNALGLGLCDRYILVNRHWIDLMDDEGILTVETANGVFKTSYDRETDVIDLYDRTGCDAAIICVDKDVPQFPSILNNFITSDDLQKLKHFSGSLVANAGRCYSLQAVTPVKLVSQPVGYSTNDETYEIGKHFQYNADCAKGYSGAVLVLNNTDMPRKLCGIHAAGVKNRNLGIAQLVTREMLDAVLANREVVTGRIIGEAQASAGCRVRVAVGGNTEILGKAPRDFVQRTPARTDIVPGPLYGAFGPPRKEPSVMSYDDVRVTEKPAEFKSPLEAGFAKYEKQPVPFLKSYLALACSLAITKIKHVVHPLVQRRVLTDDEMLNGVPGVYDRVNISTSPGLPWKLFKPQGMKGKRHLFDVDEDGRLSWGTTPYKFRYEGTSHTSIPGQQLRQATIDLENQLKDRECDVVGLTSYENLKQELLKLTKITTGKTRLFSCAPLHYNLLIRKYFGAWIAAMNANPTMMPSSVGINPHGLDWTILAKRLLSKGNAMIAGDYQGWDGQLLGSVMEKAVDVINEWYGGTKIDNLVRKRLIEYAIHTPTVLADGVFLKHQGLPSGVAITADFNSLCNRIYMMCVFTELWEDHRRCKPKCVTCRGIHPSMFNELIEDAYYGDDHILSCDRRIRCFFTFNSVKECFDAHGIGYTDARKTGGPAPDFEPLEKVSYLKREFVQSRERYLAPLDLVSIMENLNWVKKGNVGEDVLPAQIDSAMLELFHHGPTVFAETDMLIKRAAAEKAVGHLTRPYRFKDYLNDWLDQE